uniref:Uncharacterized protein n=1 Tax=Timema monikensis TaxID=170555 RepID=A0A7R9EKP6_9NEOP|nr:unnamed protein product [Timema monikensis]
MAEATASSRHLFGCPSRDLPLTILHRLIFSKFWISSTMKILSCSILLVNLDSILKSFKSDGASMRDPSLYTGSGPSDGFTEPDFNPVPDTADLGVPHQGSFWQLESFNTRIAAVIPIHHPEVTLAKPSVEGLKLAKVVQRNPHKVEIVSMTLTFLITFSAIGLFAYLCLLIGSSRGNRYLLLPAMILDMLILVLSTFTYIALMVVTFSYDTGLGVAYMLGGFVGNGLMLYFWLCVFSLFQHLREIQNIEQSQGITAVEAAELWHWRSFQSETRVGGAVVECLNGRDSQYSLDNGRSSCLGGLFRWAGRTCCRASRRSGGVCTVGPKNGAVSRSYCQSIGLVPFYEQQLVALLWFRMCNSSKFRSLELAPPPSQN